MKAFVSLEFESESGEVFDLLCVLESDNADVVRPTPDGPWHETVAVWELVKILDAQTRKSLWHLFSKNDRWRIERIAVDRVDSVG